jgi:hypothetical protein
MAGACGSDYDAMLVFPGRGVFEGYRVEGGAFIK